MKKLVSAVVVFAVILGVFSCRTNRAEAKLAMRAMYAFSLLDAPAGQIAAEAAAINAMKSAFAVLDGALTELDETAADTDGLWIKAVFFARYFGRRLPSAGNMADFARAMTLRGAPRWLKGAVKTRANAVYNTVWQAFYGGVPGATHAAIAAIAGEDLAPFAGADFAPPVDDWRALISSEYGLRHDPTSSKKELRFHNGMDLMSEQGAPVYAAQEGTVILAVRASSGYGWHIAIHHGGQISTLYAHCGALCVEQGDTVIRGQIIAAVGATGNVTGPHLHFEVIEGGLPVNPRKYLRGLTLDDRQETLVEGQGG